MRRRKLEPLFIILFVIRHLEKIVVRRRHVAEAFHLSVSTVQRAHARNLDTNSFQRRLGSGRPRCNNDDDRFIVLNSLRERHQTAVEIRNNLRDVCNSNVSVNTVRRRLAKQNLFSRRSAAIPLSVNLE